MLFWSVLSWYAEAFFFAFLVCPAGVLLSWIRQLRMLIGATSLFSFSWRSFAVVDVEASRITCCRGSRVSFTFVHVVAATLQPAVVAQANSGQLIFSGTYLVHSTDAMRRWRKGSSRPEKRPDSPRTASCLRVRSNITYVMQVGAVPVMSTPGGIPGGSVFRHSTLSVVLASAGSNWSTGKDILFTLFPFVHAEVSMMSRLWG